MLSDICEVLVVLGVWTAILGRSAACCEDDVKKLVALSTIVNLGYMMVALGSNKFEVCMFHCIVHAMVKAYLFISIGLLLHARLGCQDGRSLNL